MTDPTRTHHADHSSIVGFIWALAEKLRGPYRPSQHPILPIVSADPI